MELAKQRFIHIITQYRFRSVQLVLQIQVDVVSLLAGFLFCFTVYAETERSELMNTKKIKKTVNNCLCSAQSVTLYFACEYSVHVA
jgi:hypothetical protein